jgi:hypothetical protein
MRAPSQAAGEALARRLQQEEWASADAGAAAIARHVEGEAVP